MGDFLSLCSLFRCLFFLHLLHHFHFLLPHSLALRKKNSYEGPNGSMISGVYIFTSNMCKDRIVSFSVKTIDNLR